MIEGIDVSGYQKEIDWSQIKSDGVVQFAYAQASLGNGFDETEFATQWSAMKAAGIPHGAYHFYIAGDDGDEQAKNFLTTLDGDFGELPPAVDLEGVQSERTGAFQTGSDATPEEVVAEINALLCAIETAAGKTPIIYTNGQFAKNYLTDESFATYPLWLAQPLVSTSPNSPTSLPTVWKDWAMWQYSPTNGSPLPGVTGLVDLDRYNGTLEQLLAMK